MWKKPSEEPARSEEAFTVKLIEHNSPAVIGKTIHIRGEVTGEENLLVHGEIDGKIRLESNSLIVGKDGQVHAEISAREVFVEGTVVGDILGGEQVIVRSSGTVRGNIRAPRVTVEDGARIKGTVDMEGTEVTESREAASPSVLEHVNRLNGAVN